MTVIWSLEWGIYAEIRMESLTCWESLDTSWGFLLSLPLLTLVLMMWVGLGHTPAQHPHINHLELLAVPLDICSFLPLVQGHAVATLSDSTTAVSYISRQGGTVSSSLCRFATMLWDLCVVHCILPSVSPVAESQNMNSDLLSGGCLSPQMEPDLDLSFGWSSVLGSCGDQWETPLNSKCVDSVAGEALIHRFIES